MRVNVPARQFDKRVYVANATYHTAANRDYEAPFIAQVVDTLYRQRPDVRPDEAFRLVQRARDEYRREITQGMARGNVLQGRHETEAINVGFKVLAGLVPGPKGLAVGVAKDLFDMGVRNAQDGLDSEARFLASRGRFRHLFGL